MKFLFVCALLPMAMCLPNFLNEDKLKADVQFLAQKFASSDLTRKACEAECQRYMDEDKELNVAFGCPLACMGIQSELEKLVNPVKHSKRGFLGGFVGSLFDLETLKQDLQIMLDVVGTDPMERACENECHNLLKTGHVLNYGCPLVCHSFQNLAHMFHLKPTTAVPATTV